MDRAAVGLGSVFMHLRAEVNWYQIFHNLIEHFDGVRQLRVSLKCAIKSRSVKITKILKIKVKPSIPTSL